MVGAIRVTGDEEIMLISNAGTLVRTPVEGISILARNTQGVTLIRVGEEEKLVQIEPVAASVNGEGGGEEPESTDE